LGSPIADGNARLSIVSRAFLYERWVRRNPESSFRRRAAADVNRQYC
jgi:hypothetical protein